MPGARNAPKLWPAEPAQHDADGVRRQTARAVSASELGAEQRAKGAVAVPHRHFDANRLAALDGRARLLDDAVVDLLFELVILFPDFARRIGRRLEMQELRKIEPQPARMPHVARPELLHAPDRFIDCAEAERGHQLPRLLRDEAQVIDHMLGPCREKAHAAAGPGWRCQPNRCCSGTCAA